MNFVLVEQHYTVHSAVETAENNFIRNSTKVLQQCKQKKINFIISAPRSRGSTGSIIVESGQSHDKVCFRDFVFCSFVDICLHGLISIILSVKNLFHLHSFVFFYVTAIFNNVTD